MKLDRNVNASRRGKYALILLRQWPSAPESADRVQAALDVLSSEGMLDNGEVGTESEFFVIRLRDAYACDALRKYADDIREDDPEFAADVDAMARRAGMNSEWCKPPD